MKLFLKILLLSIFSLVIGFTGALIYYSSITNGVELDVSKLENTTSACSVYDENGCEITSTDGFTVENEPIPDVPKTGDDSNLPLWFGLLTLSGGTLAGILFFDKKRRCKA